MGGGGDGLSDLGDLMKTIFSLIPRIFGALGKLNDIGNGLFKVFEGITKEVINIYESEAEAVLDTVTFSGWILTYLFTNFMCATQIFQNINTCIFFYILDMLGQIIYMPVRLCIWIIWFLTRFDTYGLEKQIWSGLEMIDQVLLKIIGFHLIHYPKNIRDMCYNCKRLRTTALINEVDTLTTDFTEHVVKRAVAGISEIADGVGEVIGAFGNDW